MTISTTTNVVTYPGNGASTTFGFSFPIPAPQYLVVIVTDAEGNETTLSSTQYAVTGIGSNAGGSVTYPTSGSPLPDDGPTITIARSLTATQQTKLRGQDGYYPEVVEAALDYLTMLNQQFEETLTRALVFPINEGSGLVMPPRAQRANTIFFFDENGDPTFVEPEIINATAQGNNEAAQSAILAAQYAAQAQAGGAQVAALATMASDSASSAAASALIAGSAATTAAAPALVAATTATTAATAATTAANTATASASSATIAANNANAAAASATTTASAANTTANTANVNATTAVATANAASAITVTPPRNSNERTMPFPSFVVGKCTPFTRFGGAQDGTDQTAALQRAAASGRLVEFVEGDMLISATANFSSNGGGFFGVGGDQAGSAPKTRILRNFSGTASSVLANATGARLVLRDFYIGCTNSAYAGLVEGDNGLLMGQPGTGWNGGAMWSNVFIQGQWRGLLAYNGPLATLIAMQIEYCKSAAITAIDGSFSLINAKLQFNAGDAILTQSTNPSAGNLTTSNVTSYYNGGRAVTGSASSGTHGANFWSERLCSSFDNGGGVYFNYHDNLKLLELFIEYAGGGAATAGPTNPFTGLQVNWGTNANATGLVLADGTISPRVSGHIKQCTGAGATLHGVIRPRVDLTLEDNGLGYTSGSAPSRAGINIQNVVTDMDVNVICKGAAGNGTELAQKYGVVISTADNTGVIDGTTDSYLEEVPQADVDLLVRLRSPAAPSVASATQITLPLNDDFIIVTGSTSIGAISSTSRRRAPVTLKFPTSLTLAHNSGNIYLASGVNWTAPTNSTLTLRPTGVGGGWEEIARSSSNG